MPFETKCPECKRKFTAPDRALGSSGECPMCGHSFRMLPRKGFKGGANVYGVAQSAPNPGVEKKTPEETDAITPTGPHNSFDEDHRITKPQYTTRNQFFSSEGNAFDNTYGMIALLLAGLGLLCANFPVVEYLTIPLALSGMVLGIGSALLPGSVSQRLAMPAVALAIALPTFLISVKAPDWFRETRQKPTEANPRDKYLWVRPGEKPYLPEKQEESINASQFAVQRNDIRVAVAEVRYQKTEFTQDKKKQMTKEPKVHILLRVLNSGFEKPFEFSKWKSYGEGVKLYDPEGQELGEWSPPKGSLQKIVPTSTLFSGKTCEEWLIFDAPKVKFETLTLELPGQAFGAEEGKVLLLIPSKLITK